MTYKLDDEYTKIKSPIILQYCGQEIHLNSGRELADLAFEEPYKVEEIYAENDTIIMILKKSNSIPKTDWTDKRVSFF